MASRLRVPALALAAVSIVLSIAVMGCAGHAMAVYSSQQTTNPWWLPVWPGHFDLRPLQTQLGSATVLLVLDAAVVLAVLVSSLPSNAIIFGSSAVASISALVALAFPAVLHARAGGPVVDTLQTWTCGWVDTTITRGEEPPAEFATLCNETRFSYYASIPLFLMQLALLTLAIMALLGHGSSSSSSSLSTTAAGSRRTAKRGSRRIPNDGELGFVGEKSSASSVTTRSVEMDRMRQASVESGSVKSARVLVIEPKRVGHA